MKPRRPSLLLSWAVLIAPAAPAEPARRPPSDDDAVSRVRVTDAAISPDGRWVFYTERRSAPEGEQRVERHYVVPARGGPRKRFVGEASGHAFRFSPDEVSLTFLRDVGFGPQVHRLPLDGGEALAVTAHEGGVESFRWARSGRVLFFVAADGGDGRPSALWRLDPASGEETRLTDDATAVEAFEVSRDGRRVALVGRRDGGASALHRLDVEDGRVVRLADGDSPRWSPDGRRIAYRARTAPEGGLRVVDVETGVDRLLAPPGEGDLMGPWWSRDGTAVLVAETDGTRSRLRRIDHEGDGDATLLEIGGRLEVLGFSADRRRMLHALEGPETPPDLFVSSPRRRRTVRLTRSDPQTEDRLPGSAAWLGDRTLSDLDRFLVDRMESGGAPGLSVAVVRGSETVFTGAYGWADVEGRVPVTPDTLFQLASVSKTVTACVVMQLVEEAALDLDADVGDVLSFPVRHPRHPDEPITLRRLLTHTSAIRDDWDVLEGTWVTNGDFPRTLQESLRGYLAEGGEWFDADECFHEWGPGDRCRYSNVGVALAAHVAEAAAGRSFEELARRNVFEPLGMTNSSFRLRDLAFRDVAVPHEREGGRFVARGHHGYLDFPSGTLRTSAPQLARFLSCFVEGGELDGRRLLRRETVAAMREVQFPELSKEQGLVWYRDDVAGHRVLGHDGGDPGVATVMLFRPSDGVGVIVLANGDLDRAAEDAIVERLFALE